MQEDNDPLDDCVFSIHDAQQDIVGTGFFVAERWGVTCAHVITAAEAAAGSDIKIHCFLHDKDQYYSAKVHEKGWSDREADDIAFLEFSEQPPRTGCRPLTAAEYSYGNKYCSLGFPQSSIVVERRAANDIISGLVHKKGGGLLLQLEGDEVTNGMSGGPIYDTFLKKVVGMITLGQRDTTSHLVYATPAETLQRHRPDLIGEFPTLTYADRRSYRVIQNHFSSDLLDDSDELDKLLEQDKQLVRELQEWKELHNYLDQTIQIYSAFLASITPADRGKPTVENIAGHWDEIFRELDKLARWSREDMKLIAKPLIIDEKTGDIAQGPDWCIDIEPLRRDINEYLASGKKSVERYKQANPLIRLVAKKDPDEFSFTRLKDLAGDLFHDILQNMHIADVHLREKALILAAKAQMLYGVNR